MKSHNFIDLTGQKFGLLLVIEQADRIKPKIARWTCVCECGTTKIVDGRHLREEKTISCGCFARQKIGALLRTHGQSETDEYKVWCGMKRRCYNRHEKCFPRYGGVGIKVCPAWKSSFETFLLDMGKRPSPEHSIDRIDSAGDYSPDNCRWTVSFTQNRNRRSNVYLEYDGLRLVVSDWAKRTGISRVTISARIKQGWSIERTLTAPVRSAK